MQHRILVALVLLVGAVLGWLGWQFSLLSPGVAGVLRAVLFAVPLFLLGSAGVVALCIAWRRWGSHEYIKAHHVTQLTRAQAQRFPASLQHLSYHDSSRPQLAAPAGEDTPPQLAPPGAPGVPTFGQLLDQGKVGQGSKLLLGFDAASGQPIEGSWGDLYSVGVGGMTGSGKSWLAAFLIAQSAAAGARLILIDPHAGDGQSLATRLAPLSASYMCDVASTPTQIESALKLATDKLAGRIAGRGGSWPMLLIVDEWTSLLRGKLGDLLTATALDYAEQGRKYGCFALLAAQAWQIDAAGEVRDRLASHYTMRTRGDQFRYQMGLRGSAPLDTLFLKPGVAYFLSTRGELTKVSIPQMEDADLARVGQMIERPAAAVGQPFGFVSAPRTTVPTARIGAKLEPKRSQNGAGSTASQSPGAVSPEAARAISLFIAGLSPAEIVKELRGVSSKQSGSRYQAALAEVLDLIRAGMRGG